MSDLLSLDLIRAIENLETDIRTLRLAAERFQPSATQEKPKNYPLGEFDAMKWAITK